MLSRIEFANVVPGAVKLIGDDSGINETFKGFVDTGTERHKSYIKLLDGKQLINELVATTIGRSLNLPIPPGFLVRVRPRDLPDANSLSNFPPDTELLAFGSKDVDHPSLARQMKGSPSLLKRLLVTRKFKNWDEVLIFDDWVANVDRNAGNLLLAPGDEVWLIDHSHCLTGPHWIPTDLEYKEGYRNILSDIMVGSLKLQERIALKQKAANMSLLFALMESQEVLDASYAQALLSSTESMALANFLQARAPRLEHIVAERVGLPMLDLI